MISEKACIGISVAGAALGCSMVGALGGFIIGHYVSDDDYKKAGLNTGIGAAVGFSLPFLVASPYILTRLLINYCKNTEAESLINSNDSPGLVRRMVDTGLSFFSACCKTEEKANENITDYDNQNTYK